MAFGFNPKLTEAERSDRMVRRQLRKLDRRQRLLDHALADRIRKENSALVASCREQGGLLDVPENRQEDRETSPSVFFRIRYFFSETASRIGSFFSANRKPLVFTAGSIAAILVFATTSPHWGKQ